MTKYAEELDTASAVIAVARARRADRGPPPRPGLLQAAVTWAGDALDRLDRRGGHPGRGRVRRHRATGRRVRGHRLVAEFAITEFAAAIGLSTDAGKRYVGHALELRHRLPRVWQRVIDGDLRAWSARRIADQTLLLSPEAAGVCGPARRPGGAQDRPRPARPAGRGGDRHPHARAGRGTPAREGGGPVLHHRVPAGLLPRHQHRARRARPGRRPRPRTSHRRPRDPAQGPRLHDSLDVRRAAAVGELARAPMALDLTTEDDPKRRDRHERSGGALRPPLRGRPARDRHRPAGAGQPAGHRRPGPRLVPHRRQRSP